MGDQTVFPEEIDPQDSDTFQTLEERCLTEGDWYRLELLYDRYVSEIDDDAFDYPRLADRLTDMIDEVDDSEAARIGVELGDLHVRELGNLQEAKQAYKESFLTDKSETTGLERARDIYRLEDKWYKVLEICDLQLQVTQEASDEAALLREKAQVHAERLDHLDEAEKFVERALDRRPDSDRLEKLQEIYSSGKTVASVIDQLVDLADHAYESDNAEMAVEQYLRAARLEAIREGGDPDEAIGWIERVLEHDPDHEEARDVLEELECRAAAERAGARPGSMVDDAPESLSFETGRDGGAPLEQAPVDDEGTAPAPAQMIPDDEADVDEREDEPDPVESDEAEAESAGESTDDDAIEASDADEDDDSSASDPVEQLYADVSPFEGSPEDAREALDDDPSDLSALAAWRDRQLEDERFQPLADQLEETVQYFRKEDEEPALRLDLARLYWREIEDLEQAEKRFKQLKLLDIEVPDVFAFYRHYRRERGDWRRLFSLLGDRLDEVDAPEERRELVTRRAEIAETEMESPEQAINVWKRYLREHGNDERARAELERLYEANDKWNGLVGFLEDEVERLESEGDASRGRRIELLERTADLYEEKLGREVKARKRLERVVSLQPDRDDAFERLRDKLESNRSWSDLVDLLSDRMERLEVADKLERAADYAEEIAELLDEHQLRRGEQADDYWQRALEWDPSRDHIRERLEELYRSHREHEKLFELKRQHLERLDEEDHLEQLQELRELAEETLHDPDRLVPVLRSILDHTPDDRDVLQQLAELYRDRESWNDLLSNLERQIELLEGDERIEALREAARIQEHHLDDLDASIERWERVLDEDPSNEEAIGQLTDLYLEAEHYDELETLYREREHFQRLFDLFDSAAQMTDERRHRADLYRRMAQLADEELDDLDGILISLESLLEVTDRIEEVARELADWYRQADELTQEIEMMELVLDEVDEDDERLGVLERLATLRAEQEHPEEAFHRQMQAIEIDPSRSDAIQRAEGFAENAGARIEFSEMLETIAEGLEDECQTALWWTIARIEAEQLERPERALSFYECIHEREPDDLEVLEALSKLYDTLDQYESLVETLRHQIERRRERGADDRDLIETLHRVADVQRLELERSEGPRATYREILAIDSDYLPAIRGMKALHRDDEAWDEVVDRLERELECLPPSDDEARREVQFELAEVHRRHQDDYDEALHHYRHILEVAPDHDETIEAVRDVLDQPNHARSAALILEPVFRRREAFESLADTLEAHLEATEDAYEAQDVLDELIPLHRDELDHPTRAFALARSQFERDPDREEVRDRLESLAGQIERREDVESLYTDYVFAEDGGGGSNIRYDLLRRLTRIRRGHLDDLEGAVDALETYYDWAEDQAEAARELEELYRALDRHEDLVGILEDRASYAESDEMRITLHEEAAQLCDEKLDQPERAIERHRAILDLDPGRDASVEALERLLRATERWEDLHTLLLSHLDRLDDENRRRDTLLKVARIRAKQLEDYKGAEELLRDLIADHPDDDEIIEATEDLDAELIKTSGDHYDLRERVARHLEPVYRRRDAHEPLADVLEVQLRGDDDPMRRRERLDELAELYAGPLERPETAFEKYQSAVMLDPDDPERREAFESIGREHERLDEVVSTLEDASDGADPATAADIDRRLGEMYEHDLDDPGRAIDAYRRTLDYNDADPEALRALERLYERTGAIEPLTDTLRHQVTHGDPERRPALLERIGELERDELDRPDRAIDAYEQWLALEPECRPAIGALESLYQQREDWPELADLLRRKAELVETDDDAFETRLQLARILEEELLRPDEAVATYEDVLELEPGALEALDALERLHREADQWADVADVLRRRLTTDEGDDPERRTEIELQLADILRTELHDIEDAIELYRVVLSRESDHPKAIDALETIADDPAYTELVIDDLVDHYERQEAWSDLIALYERRAAQVAEPERRASLLSCIGETYRDGLDDPGSAIEMFAQAWELIPSDEAVESALLELVERREAWNRLADIYRDVLPALDDLERRTELHMRLADLERDRLDDPIEAEQEYREVLTIDERHYEAYDALEALLIDQERWLDLVDLLENKLDVVREDEDEAAAIELLSEIAEYQRNAIEDPFSAVETYERVLELDASHESALEALSELYRQQERWEDLAEHVERRLEMATTEEDYVTFSNELADVRRKHLYQPDRALDRYEDILDIRPEHAETVEALESMLEQPAESIDRITELLESTYRAGDQWHDLVEILTRRAELADERSRELDRLEEAIELADERIGDVERAFALAGRRFERVPLDTEARNRLQHLAARTDRWEDAVDRYDNALQQEATPGTDGRATLLAEQAHMFESRLDDLEQSRRAYGEALLEAPHFDPALEGLERVLWRLEDWGGVETFYRERADEAESPDARCDWLLDLARCRESVSHDLQGALETYRDVYDLDPGHEEAREAIKRLYRREGRWRDLVEFYRRQIGEAEEGSERLVELLLAVGRVLERHLDDIEGAIHQYRRILEIEPDHAGARRALDGLRERLRALDDEARSNRLLVLDELLERQDDDADWRYRVELLEDKREMLEDVESCAKLAMEEAELIETHADHRLERVDLIPKVARAYALRPDRDAYRDRLETIANTFDAWRRVPGALLESLDVLKSPEHRAELLVEIGNLYVERLEDVASAVTAYRRAADLTAPTRALDALESLLPRLERWGDLTDVLETRLELTPERGERRRLLERLGELYDDVLERPDRAADYYEKLLELDPDEVDYYATLESLYEQTGAYDDLEGVLSSWLDRSDDEETRVRLLRRLANLQERELDKPKAAIETYRSLHAQVESDRAVVDALVRLYERTERWPELLQVLGLQRDFAERPDEINQIEFREGRLQMNKLDDPASALESFRSILDRNRDHIEARRAVESLAERADDVAREASDFLQNLYREGEAWTMLEELLERQLDVVDDPGRRAELYLELGQLYEESFDNRQTAFAMLGRGVREHPGVEALRHELDRLSRGLENAEELVAIYEETLERDLDDATERRDLRMAAAETVAERLEDFDRARAHIHAILDRDAYDPDALELLDRIDQKEQNWHDLVDVLERRIEIAEAETINDLRFRLGYLHENMLDWPQSALEQYREVLQDEPEHKRALEGLERLVEEPDLRLKIADLLEPVYRRHDNDHKLVQLFELKLEVLDAPPELAELHKQIADIRIDQLDELEAGYAHLGKAFRANPHDGEVQQRLESLAAMHGMYEHLVALYEDLLDELTDPIRVVELGERAAQWANNALDQPDRSADLYRRILDIEPEHEEAVEGLEIIAREQGRREELEDVLQRKADLLFEPDLQREVLMELGEVRTELEAYESATEAYRQALLLDESDTEVMEQLVGLYEMTEQHEELVDTLERLAQHTEDPEESIQLNLEIARYAEHFLDRPDRAIEAGERIRQLDASNREALELLETLYDDQQRWGDLVELRRHLLEIVEEEDDDPDELARLARDLGELVYTKRDDLESAIDWYRTALEHRPGDPDTLDRLQTLYREDERWSALTDLLDEQLEIVDSEAKRANLLLERAELHLEHLDDIEGAQEDLQRALEIDPEHPRILDVQSDIYRYEEDWEGLLEAFDRQLEQVEDDDVEAPIRWRRGELLDTRLERTDEAIEAYRQVLDLEPTHEEALAALRRLYERRGDNEALYRMLEHEAEHLGDADERVECYLEMAKLADEQLERPEWAVGALAAARDEQPHNLEVVQPLAEFCIELGDHERALPIVDDLVETLDEKGDDDQLVEFRHLRGQLYAEQGAVGAAREEYEAVYRMDDTYIPNLMSLGELCIEQEEWEEAKRHFQQVRLHQMKLDSDQQKVAMYYNLGRIRRALGDERRARERFERALSIDDSHELSQQALDDM